MDITKEQLVDVLTDQQVKTAIYSLQEHWDLANLIVLIFGVLAGGASAYYIYKQVRDAREADRQERIRLKKEFAVRLLDRWRDQQRPDVVSAYQLARSFSYQQCLILTNRQLTSIHLDATEELKLLTQLAFSYKFDGFNVDNLVKEGKIYLDGVHVFHIRFCVISRLDLLESVLLAWRLDVADREIIEDAFAFLRDDAVNLKNYRDALNWTAGRECNPSIADFVSAIENAGPARPRGHPESGQLRRRWLW
jgi:hypothetical protein